MEIDPVHIKRFPRGNPQSQITHSCNFPYRVLSIDLNGDCFVCWCEGYLPISVGNILDFSTIEQVWESPVARQLQEDVDQKKFSFCAVTHCGIAEGDMLFDEFYISINVDESCNLACPTCRRGLVNHISGPLFDKRQEILNHLVKLISNFKKPFKLVTSGNGDPLASLIVRPLILNWVPTNQQTIRLCTNGLLLKKLLPTSTVFPYINDFQISVDAGSKEVYEDVRRPGKFEVLQENLQWLADNKKEDVYVSLIFCLSAANARDLINFANLCKKYEFLGVVVPLNNWHTFDNFNDHEVINNKEHPLHQLAIDQLTQVQHLPYIYMSPYLRSIL